MSNDDKLTQGTPAWFEMVGANVMEAAAKAPLPADLSTSLVEIYTDGTTLPGGKVQGIRFDVDRGKPSYRVGAEPGENADVVVEVTAPAARALNLLRSDDPRYAAAREGYAASGELRLRGDPSAWAWLDAAHDPIVALTK